MATAAAMGKLSCAVPFAADDGCDHVFAAKLTPNGESSPRIETRPALGLEDRGLFSSAGPTESMSTFPSRNHLIGLGSRSAYLSEQANIKFCLLRHGPMPIYRPGGQSLSPKEDTDGRNWFSRQATARGGGGSEEAIRRPETLRMTLSVRTRNLRARGQRGEIHRIGW
jgi:hypothetical protein